ncbi:MAG: Fe-S protein assembly co-chaperone HscB [Saprospiraceae bacterium]|nr:Fe-S protein assembly co-chaperone HscB [Saprospiraceae bacterium]
MNYFEHYQLAPAFYIDQNELRRKYYQKSRSVHPDQNPENNSIAHHDDYLSALNNQAYKTLLHPLSRLKYLLDTEFEAGKGELIQDSQEFLLEMLELHEFIMEAIQAGDLNLMEQAKEQLNSLEKDADEKASPALRDFDQGLRNDRIRNEMQHYYNQLKYVNRLRENLENKEPSL